MVTLFCFSSNKKQVARPSHPQAAYLFTEHIADWELQPGRHNKENVHAVHFMGDPGALMARLGPSPSEHKSLNSPTLLALCGR